MALFGANICMFVVPDVAWSTRAVTFCSPKIKASAHVHADYLLKKGPLSARTWLAGSTILGVNVVAVVNIVSDLCH